MVVGPWQLILSGRDWIRDRLNISGPFEVVQKEPPHPVIVTPPRAMPVLGPVVSSIFKYTPSPTETPKGMPTDVPGAPRGTPTERAGPESAESAPRAAQPPQETVPGVPRPNPNPVRHDTEVQGPPSGCDPEFGKQAEGLRTPDATGIGLGNFPKPAPIPKDINELDKIAKGYDKGWYPRMVEWGITTVPGGLLVYTSATFTIQNIKTGAAHDLESFKKAAGEAKDHPNPSTVYAAAAAGALLFVSAAAPVLAF